MQVIRRDEKSKNAGLTRKRLVRIYVYVATGDMGERGRKPSASERAMRCERVIRLRFRLMGGNYYGKERGYEAESETTRRAREGQLV